MPHKDPEARRAYLREYELRPEVIARRKRLYKEKYGARARARNADPEITARNRASYLKRVRGITQEEYDSLMERQDGACAICKSSCSTGRPLAVDHDHNTGEVRGLLCMNCNTALGQLKEDASLVRDAADYLESKGLCEWLGFPDFCE